MPDIRLATIGSVVLAFVIAAVVVQAVRWIVHRMLGALHIVSAENRTAVHERARQLIRALTMLAYGVAAIVAISLTLNRFGFNEPSWDPRYFAHWVFTHGVNLVIIGVAAFIVVRAANLAIEHLQFKLAGRHGGADPEWQRRAATLGGILTSVVTASVGFIAVLMVLRELSVDVVPILTGAGIAGLAIGFGAQNLVRDVISGFFLILEDQVRIGNLARINGVTGMVEQINLRTIILRDGDGAVQVFPNGTITALANLSKHYAYAVVDVKIAYSENIDRVFGTIREVGGALQRDPSWSPILLAPIEVLGIDSLEGGLANVRSRFKTLPLSQGKVASELRKRLLGAFVGRGIKPYA